MVLVTIILVTIAAYLVVGILIAIPFILRGVSRFDPAAATAPWTFRALILPGVVALWPIALAWWIRSLRATDPGSAGSVPSYHDPAGSHP